MKIRDLRGVQPVYPSNSTFLDLRNNNQQNVQNKNEEQPTKDFKSILQDEISKQK